MPHLIHKVSWPPKDSQALEMQESSCASGGSKLFSLIHPSQRGSSFTGQREPAISAIAMTEKYMVSYPEACSNLEGYKRFL